MTYKTVEFDANYPAPRQVTEPLNSTYGVAVKVKENGQYIDCALSVDGLSAARGPDGWLLAEFSTGSAPATKELGVAAEAVTEGTWQETYDRTISRRQNWVSLTPISPTTPIPFLQGEDKLVAAKISEYGITAQLGDGEPYPLDLSACRIRKGATTSYMVKDGMFVNPDYLQDTAAELPLGDGSFIDLATGSLTDSPPSGIINVKADVTFKYETEKKDFGFKLFVQEQDLGYADTGD